MEFKKGRQLYINVLLDKHNFRGQQTIQTNKNTEFLSGKRCMPLFLVSSKVAMFSLRTVFAGLFLHCNNNSSFLHDVIYYSKEIQGTEGSRIMKSINSGSLFQYSDTSSFQEMAEMETRFTRIMFSLARTYANC